MAGDVVLEKLSTAQAARRAGVSGEAIRDWMRSGRLPYEATALGALIDAVDLDEVIAERDRARRAPRVKNRQVRA